MRGLLMCDTGRQRASLKLVTALLALDLAALIAVIALGELELAALMSVVEAALLLINSAENLAALRKSSEMPDDGPVATVRYRPLKKCDGAVFAFEEVEAGESQDDA